jgi:hypothetical protein
MKNYKSMTSIELITSFIDVTNAIHALNREFALKKGCDSIDIDEIIDKIFNDEADIPTEGGASYLNNISRLVADKWSMRDEWNRRSHEASIGKDGEYGLENIEAMAFMYESMKGQSEDDMGRILRNIICITFYNNIHDADKWIVAE